MSINFCSSLQENLAPFHITANISLISLLSLDISLQLSDSVVSILVSETFMSIFEQPNIVIIGAVAFLQASNFLGSSNFELCLYSLNIQANFTKLTEASDLSNISFKYHKFADVFSKTKAKVLTPHCSWNLQINLEEGAQPSVGPIYSLSASEKEALKKFIKENLNTGFI